MIDENRGESIKSNLLYLAHETLANEASDKISIRQRIIGWNAPQKIFGEEFEIYSAYLSYSQDSAYFRVDAFIIGLEGMKLQVQQNGAGKYYDNDFSEYILQKAEQILVHPHELCIDSMRKKLEAEKNLSTLLSWHRLGQERARSS